MLRNYIKIAWRNIVKGKLYSVINITGLAIGLACSVFILLYIQKELSYDQFHAQKDRIYRISSEFYGRDGWSGTAWAVHPLAEVVQDNIPEVEEVAQLSVDGNNTIVSFGEKQFYEKDFAHATVSFFNIFSFRVVRGDTASLNQPFTLFMSESMAHKYFPGQDAIGKTLTINNETEYMVTGVFADFPDNSHIQLDFIGSRQSQIASGDVEPGNWMGGGAFTYVLLGEKTDPNLFRQKLTDIRDNYVLDGFGMSSENPRIRLVATPLTDIHLYTNFSSEQIPQGDITYIYIFASIALLILLIAAINYMNLATARSATRSREVGVRKTSGALRSQLIKQYLGESLVTVFFAMVLAALLIELFLPAVNNLLDRSLAISWVDPGFMVMFVGLWLIIGIGAGLYPALFLSGFKPIKALKTTGPVHSKGALRKGLVTFQLFISVALIICTIIIQRQMSYVQGSQPGFSKSQVLMIPNTQTIDEQLSTLESEIGSLAGVEYVTTSSFEPGISGGISSVEAKDIEGFESESQARFEVIWGGVDFTETFGLQMAAGRSFYPAYAMDMEHSILINEATADYLGWDKPVGKTINYFGTEKQVIGVVEDFHIYSLRQKIEPLLVIPTKESSRNLAVRISSQSLSGTISEIEQTWQAVIPGMPFRYQFLDD